MTKQIISEENSVYKPGKLLTGATMKRFFTLLVLTLFAGSILGQSINLNQGSIKQKRYFQKIPYQNIDGKLIVPVTISGKTYNFLFDTGAPLIISNKIFKEFDLPIIGQIGIIDSGDAIKEMQCILLPVLQLQEIIFINTVGVVHHDESSDYFDLFECFEIDGTIGSNMLRNSVVQFDEQNKHIIITDNYRKISKKEPKYQWIQMELIPSQSSPLIWTGLKKGEQKTRDNGVLFDTGDPNLYVMSMNAYDWFNEHNDIVDKIAESEGSFAWGMHGFFDKQRHLLLSIPELYVCGKMFDNVIINTTNSGSIIGSHLLKFGKVTLDYKRKRFIYEPFDGVNTYELSERPWAIFPKLQNDRLVVGIIWDKALESQINQGDEILSIEGLNIENMAICDYIKLGFSKESFTGKRNLELRDIKTGEVKTVEIKRL